jgi:hypothetical protein
VLAFKAIDRIDFAAAPHDADRMTLPDWVVGRFEKRPFWFANPGVWALECKKNEVAITELWMAPENSFNGSLPLLRIAIAAITEKGFSLPRRPNNQA